MQDQEWKTSAEVAKMFGLKINAIQKHVSRGHVTPKMFANRFIWSSENIEELKRYLRSEKKKSLTGDI